MYRITEKRNYIDLVGIKLTSWNFDATCRFRLVLKTFDIRFPFSTILYLRYRLPRRLILLALFPQTNIFIIRQDISVSKTKPINLYFAADIHWSENSEKYSSQDSFFICHDVKYVYVFPSIWNNEVATYLNWDSEFKFDCKFFILCEIIKFRFIDQISIGCIQGVLRKN